jgi:hypothetical protein
VALSIACIFYLEIMIFGSSKFVQSAAISVYSFAAVYTSATSKPFAQESFTVTDCCCAFPTDAIALKFAIISQNLKSQGC